MKKNLLIRLKPLLLGAIVLLIAQPAHSAFRIPDLANGDIYEAGDFEHGPIKFKSRGPNANLDSPWLLSHNGPMGPKAVNSVDGGKPVRSGKYAMESHLTRGDSLGLTLDTGINNEDKFPYRAELIPRVKGLQDYHTEYWYGFSMYIPEGWVVDGIFENYAQWRVGGDDPAAKKANPTLTFGAVSNTSGLMRIVNRTEPNGGIKSLKNIPIDDLRGKWTDWVVRVKWSHGSDGYLQIWQNGEQIVDDRGANSPDFGNGHAPLGRIGLYKASWKKPGIIKYRNKLIATEFSTPNSQDNYFKFLIPKF